MKRSPPILIVAVGVVAALVGIQACHESVQGPTNIPPAPQLQKIALTGNTSLDTIGATSQLTVTASYTDGTTKDITVSVQWSLSDASVASVGSNGLLTAKALGATAVGAEYLGRRDNKIVRVTPPGTFTVRGRVREPGSGSIAGARVTQVGSGQSTLTNENGEYSMGGLTGAQLSFEKDSYEPGQLEATQDGYDDSPLQRIVRMAVGDTITPTLAPHDMDYVVAPDVRCYPCRLIRVTSSGPGAIRIRLTWAETRAKLNLWINGQIYAPATNGSAEVVADVSVGGGDLVVYVGQVSTAAFEAYVLLTLSAQVNLAR